MNRSSPPRRSPSSIPPPSERLPDSQSLRPPPLPREARTPSAPPVRQSSIPPSREAPTPSTLMRYQLTPGEVKVLQHFHQQLQSFGDKGAIMGNMLAVLMALDRGVGEVEHFTELTANRVLLETMRASAPGTGSQGGQA